MDYQVTLKGPNGAEKTITVKDDEYILNEAEEKGIDIPYLCRTGTCSSCTGLIKEGMIDQKDQSFLDDDQIKKGYALLCVSFPKSDLVIETHKKDDLY